jgi:flagellar protein FlaF
MGFSVSGATAVVYVGLLVSAAVLVPAVDRYAERHVEAVETRDERALDRRNTAIGAPNATYNATDDRLVVVVENTGTTTLAVSRVDLLVDGRYRAVAPANATVDGTETTTWLPGERLRLVVVDPVRPDRVKVVTGGGVAATEEVA